MDIEEKIFAKKLYLTREQIHEMMKNNMFLDFLETIILD